MAKAGWHARAHDWPIGVHIRGFGAPTIRVDGVLAPLRALTLCGTVAPILLTAAWVAGGLVQRGYSARREDISALAAMDAEHAWIMIAGLATSGALTAAFAVGLGWGVRGSRIGPAVVGLVGVGMVALGFLRNDCSSLTEACKARVEAGAVSWHHRAHDVVSVPVFAAAVIAPLLMAWTFRSNTCFSPLALYSISTAAALAVLFALGGVEAFPAWDGAIQRAAVTAAILWMEVIALRLLRHASRRI